jgi:nucleolar GTP-binding protein
MAPSGFKRMQPVPPVASFLDIVLSKTQRKTPTVVHKGYPIPRIRAFYMKKVKFTRDTFNEKISEIITDFPRLEDIHPFFADLANVLYDKDHYKLALGQLSTAKHLIEKVAADYVKLLKYGDSLYRCKSLKRAALGRMATILKRQKDALEYLEQVRQHMSRLPSIDPNTRTLLVCGYPNVGKSSFVNAITNAHVDVQPYAFTTKSLFVGHFDYKFLRWQVIDTPGVLDHPLEERNTIEMQSITALAHIRACVLFFIDISERCGYSIEQQVALFKSLKPLFSNKPAVIVLNKIDLIRPEDVSEENKAILQGLLDEGYLIANSSCVTEEGIFDVRNGACDKLLTLRVEQKMTGQKINDVLNRLHLAVPKSRDSLSRPPFIPPSVLVQRQAKQEMQQLGIKPILARDIEAQNGGAGVYSVDLKKSYLFKDDDWKHDVMPEIVDGHNVADFFDPDIEERLAKLEAEEEIFDYDESFMDLTGDQQLAKGKYEVIEADREMKIMKHRAGKRYAKRPLLVDRIKQRKFKITSTGIEGEDAQDEIKLLRSSRARSISRAPTKDRSALKDKKASEKADKIKTLAQKQPNLMARRGEADREIQASKPKWFFTGKRKLGSTNRR